MSERHLNHGEDKYWRRRKGSSDDRLNAEAAFAQDGKHVIRQRGSKKLWSQPRTMRFHPAAFGGKWDGADIRTMNRLKGVGRPPLVLFKQAQKQRLLSTDLITKALKGWGF